MVVIVVAAVVAVVAIAAFVVFVVFALLGIDWWSVASAVAVTFAVIV